MTTFSHAPVEVPLAADRDGQISLTAQITAQLRAALASGHFTAGERLPSTRALAVSLGVSRTVVTTVYAQLFAEGWLEGRHGSGTYVAPGAPGAPATPGALGAPGASDTPGAPGAPGIVSALDAPLKPKAPETPKAPHAPAAVGTRTADPMITEYSRHIRPEIFRDHGIGGFEGCGGGDGIEGIGRLAGIAAAGPVIDLRPGIPWTDG